MERIFFYRLFFYALGALGVALMALSAAQSIMEARLAQIQYANGAAPATQVQTQGASQGGGSGELAQPVAEPRP